MVASKQQPQSRIACCDMTTREKDTPIGAGVGGTAASGVIGDQVGKDKKWMPGKRDLDNHNQKEKTCLEPYC